MTDHIAGMMWNKNEGDILEEIIISILPHVDSLLIADDGSTDNSWSIIESCKANYKKIEHIQRKPDPNDKGQRQSLLNEIRRRYKPESTWVQVCESDIKILETSVRDAIKNYSVKDSYVPWLTLNAVRLPGTWNEVDTYPNWKQPISHIMPYAHIMEVMQYSFRPYPDLKYSEIWRPWPAGFQKYVGSHPELPQGRFRPLLLHLGYRGPTHFYEKYKSMGKRHIKYQNWDLTSPQTVEQTVDFFCGTWNKDAFPASRFGIINRKNGTLSDKTV